MLSAILPPVGSEKRVKWITTTILRRGAAYAQQGHLDKAVSDYSYASGINPDNAALKSDVNKMKNALEAQRAGHLNISPSNAGTISSGSSDKTNVKVEDI
jgi:regulator of sirC expression with transglutaminase-like and TPR domain